MDWHKYIALGMLKNTGHVQPSSCLTWSPAHQ